MATHYYLVIQGVSGDYSDTLLTGAFQVGDFGFLTTTDSGTSAYDPLNLLLDSGSYAALLTDLGQGTAISGVSLIGETTGGANGPQITYDLNLSNVVVTNLLAGSGTAEVSLTLDYNKIGLVTTDVGPTGQLQTPQSFGWDIKQNAATGSGTELTSSGFAAVGATAPVTYYLLIDGFQGDSIDSAHTGWFDLGSFGIDASNPSNIQTGGPGGGSPTFGDLSVTIQGDLAALLADSSSGDALKGVEIEGVTADGTAVYDLEVANAKIDEIAETSTAGYTVDFNYSQIGLVTRSETSVGKATQTGSSGWDLTKNEFIDATSLPTLQAGGSAFSAGAASSYYLVINGVAGDYSDTLLTGAFKVSDLRFLTQNNGTSFDPLSLTLNSDSYAALMTDLGEGTVISGVSLIGEATSGGIPAITYDLNLSNVVVTDLLKDSGFSGVSLTLDYNKIGLVTNGFDTNGKLQTPQSFGWDITQNAPTDSGAELTSAGPAAVGATAPVTYYLLIDGFQGGSTDSAHTGWFDLSSFDIQASNLSNIQTGVPGKVTFGDLSVSLQGDLAALLADSGSGTALRGVKIEGVTADGTAVYDLEVAQAKIDGITDTSGQGVTIDFNYSQIGLITRSETSVGKGKQTGSSGWDLTKNETIGATSLPTLQAGGSAFSAGAASSYYLVVNGVVGDYSDTLLTGAFKVGDLRFLTQNSGTSSYDPLSLTLRSDSYATLMTDLGEGTVISGVSLIGEATSGGIPAITYDLNLSNVVVTDLLADNGFSGINLTLDYNKIGLNTDGFDAKGKLQTPQSFGWDITQNAPTDSGAELTSAGPAAVGATAPVTYYLLIDGFNGGSVDPKHAGWFAISGFDIDADHPSNIQTGGPSGGGPSFGELAVNTAADGAGLPGALTDSAIGAALKGVEIEGVTADGTAVYDLEVTNVKIDTIVDTSSPGYTIDFSYGQIDLITKSETTAGKATQTGTFGWDVAKDQSISNPSLLHLDVGAPCYCPGTLILTDRGEVAVETLAIGDVVTTMSGAARPIKWIGRRGYAGRFALGQKDILPICIKAGALDENTPRRDLWISPHHAMFLEGVLIEARDLVNGVSVLQAETIDHVEYFHIELETHDVLVVEGSFSESFIDDDSRNMFHNAPEYRTLYPVDEQGAARYCAPRVDAGYAVERARRHLEARAGLRPATDDNAVTLRGYVDQIGSQRISGWAQNPDRPEAPVCLDIYAGGRLIGQTLANRYREDLQQAGLGSGRHGFDFTPPAGLILAPHAIEVRRSFDGAALSASWAIRTHRAA